MPSLLVGKSILLALVISIFFCYLVCASFCSLTCFLFFTNECTELDNKTIVIQLFKDAGTEVGKGTTGHN